MDKVRFYKGPLVEKNRDHIKLNNSKTVLNFICIRNLNFFPVNIDSSAVTLSPCQVDTSRSISASDDFLLT